MCMCFNGYWLDINKHASRSGTTVVGILGEGAHACRDYHHLAFQEDVEYFDNLIEYCFWFIEYYNTECAYNVTRNVHVHDNFCRFAAAGWGCTPERKNKSPMCRFIRRADVTENYVTENNIFETAGGFIYNHTPPLEPEGCLTFRGNTYIQHAGGNFAEWGGELVPFTEEAAAHFLDGTLHEKDYTLLAIE